MTDRSEPRDPLDLIDLTEPSPPVRESDGVQSPALTALVRLRFEREARRTAAHDGDTPKAEQA